LPRSGIKKVIDTIEDSLHSFSRARLPKTLLIREPATGINQKVLLKRRSIKRIPFNTGRNADDKLYLVLVPLVKAPQLPATGTLVQMHPASGSEPNGGLLEIRLGFKLEKIRKASASTGHISGAAQRSR
jgi:hypothetical protein